MIDRWLWAAILAVGIIVAGVLHGGIYTMKATKDGRIFLRINRLMGGIEVCKVARPVKDEFGFTILKIECRNDYHQ